MLPHLRNGRDLSAEQRIRYRLSPAAEERLRRLRVSATTAQRGLDDPLRGALSARNGGAPIVDQFEGDLPSYSVDQIGSGTSPDIERGLKSSIHVSENIPSRYGTAALHDHQPGQLQGEITTNGFAVVNASTASSDPSSVQSEPTAGTYLRSYGSNYQRVGTHAANHTAQQAVRPLFRRTGLVERAQDALPPDVGRDYVGVQPRALGIHPTGARPGHPQDNSAAGKPD
ncbi:hypothetical protein PTTG_07762, partial [Puccinia triticina 1-1 BBBD Race 1]